MTARSEVKSLRKLHFLGFQSMYILLSPDTPGGHVTQRLSCDRARIYCAAPKKSRSDFLSVETIFLSEKREFQRSRPILEQDTVSFHHSVGMDDSSSFERSSRSMSKGSTKGCVSFTYSISSKQGKRRTLRLHSLKKSPGGLFSRKR